MSAGSGGMQIFIKTLTGKTVTLTLTCRQQTTPSPEGGLLLDLPKRGLPLLTGELLGEDCLEKLTNCTAEK